MATPTSMVVVLLLTFLPRLASAAEPTVLRVGASPGANATTIAGGVKLVPRQRPERWTILVEPGTYRERVWVDAALGPLTLQGLGAPEETLLIFGCCPGGNGRRGCANGSVEQACLPQHPGAGMSRGVETLLVEANDFVMTNMSVANDACGYNNRIAGQSEAVQLLGDRSSFRHARFLGAQDTIFSGGLGARQYFLQSFVNGSCDSIYGSSSAVFDRSEITITNHVTAMRGGFYQGARSTYLFSECSLLKPRPGEYGYPAPVGRTDLGRPWGSLSNVIFKDTFMDDHIAGYGWNDWSHQCSASAERGADCAARKTCWCQNVTYAEYRSRGPGASPARLAQRVRWSRQLSPEEAQAISPAKVLRGWQPPVADGPLADGTPDVIVV
eukprot:TRINITY_DN20384_c0_g1_i1.p1 TRINITY_DN20384_c0_g1~~TRINITY_DN20384_c0_g1_i1.p1  ORF type:complete len:384 (+),score=81.38 TRINITY_DN20384_c0_g1_i1:67-1218(+)